MDVRRRYEFIEGIKNLCAILGVIAIGCGLGLLFSRGVAGHTPIPDPLAVRYRWFSGFAQQCAVRKVPNGPVLPCTQFSCAELAGMRTEWHEPE